MDSTMNLTQEHFDAWPNVTDADIKQVSQPEDLYFYKDITLKGNYKDFWKEFLEYNLFEPKITYG